MNRLALLVVLLLVALTAATQVPLAGQAGSGAVVIRGGTVLTVTRGAIRNGAVLLRDGKIAAIGADVAVPAGAQVLDVTGKFVTPGIIDAHSHIAADSINEGGTTVSSMTGIEDVLDPTDINIYRDLGGGLTTANVLHGSANPIGGKSAVIKLRWGKTRPEELLFDGAMPGIKFALGENPTRPGRTPQPGGAQQAPRRYPGSRPGVEYVIRDAFTRAKAYQRAWQEYERRKKAGEDVVAPRRDYQLDPLVEILEGKRLVHAHCYRADEILMLIRLAEEMGFKIATFQHVLEGYKVAKEIAAHGAGASTFADWWGFKIEAIDAIPYNAAIMTRKGVLVSINSDSPEHARRLNSEAAKTVKWGGLSDDEALALVTINPAKQLRIDTRVGSLEVGKDADVVVWTHHPLSSYAVVDRAYIDGTLYYDRQAEERKLTEVVKEKATLAGAEKGDRRAPATEPHTTSSPRDSAGDGTAVGTQGTGVAAGSSGTNPGVAAGFSRTSTDQRTTTDVASGFSRTDTDQRTTTDVASGFSRTSTDQRTAAAAGDAIAITNARIHPVTRPTMDRGTIVIRDGTIEAVGADVIAPAGAKVIDAKGADVYPGFINARTALGLDEPGASGFEDTNEILDFNPQLRTRVAYHNDSEGIPVARTNGVTTVAVMPSGGILSGQVPLMNLDGWTWEESTVQPQVGIAFQFPTIGPRRFGGGFGPDPDRDRSYEDLKKERDAKLDELSRLLDQARAYAKAAAPTRRMDWVLDALVPVVERRLPLITTANTERDIRDAIAFADRANVRIVISGGLEAPLVAPLLNEKNVPVILGSVLTPPTREDMWHAATYQAAGELAQAGVKFCFATGDNTNVRLLPYQAAISVAWGLAREEAVKAITINAAEILGVADRLGSIEPGKMANLVVAKGDPLEIRTEVTHVFINGRDVGLNDKHRALYERYLARP